MRVVRVLGLHAAVAIAGVLALGGCEWNALLRKQASDSLRKQDYALAEQRLQRAVQRDPTDWRSHELLGTLLLSEGRPLEAQHWLEKALALRPADAEASRIRDELAESLYRQGDHEALVRMVREAREPVGTSADFRREGRYLGRIGDVDSAVVAFRKAARFAPGDAAPYLELAELYQSTGNSQAAIDALRRAYGVDPHEVEISRRLRRYGVVPGPTVALPPFTSGNP